MGLETNNVTEEIERQTDVQTYRHPDIQRKKERQVDRQTDRQI